MDYKEVLTSTDGRISRSEFWLKGVMVIFIIMLFIGLIDKILGANGSLYTIGALASIYPNIAIGIKRFHDRNKSGWWVLIQLVPIIGGFWYLIECGFLKGTEGPNDFGTDPTA